VPISPNQGEELGQVDFEVDLARLLVAGCRLLPCEAEPHVEYEAISERWQQHKKQF
jgi:hypothetical protein